MRLEERRDAVMIYTVTFNPSLDYVVSVDRFQLGMVNRAGGEELYPGGKGINVSVVLSNLGIKSRALGFLAGFTGDEIQRELTQFGCDADFIRLPRGNSRINVKLRSEQESEINGQGPKIPIEAIEELYQKLDALSGGDYLVLAGSIPNTLPEDMYERIMERLDGRGIQIVVDATKDLLLNVLKYKPFLIKPNNHELGEMFGTALKTDEQIVEHAKKLQKMGARNVLVSMAKKGGIFVDQNGQVYQSLPPDGVVKNSVGAGDSMVAGFLTGYLKTQDFQKAFKMGLATGSASAFQEWLAQREDVLKLLDHPEQYGFLQ